MKKVLLFLLTFLLMTPVFVFAYEVPKLYFYKHDEQGNIIDDAEFKIRDLNNKVQYDVAFDTYYGAYSYLSLYEDNYNNLVDIMPTDVKEIVNNFSKMEDFEPYLAKVKKKGTNYFYKKMVVECREAVPSECNAGSNELQIRKLNAKNKYSLCSVIVPTIMFLEETKTPKGFEKAMAVLPADITIDYRFNQDTEMISETSVLLNLRPIRYDDEGYPIYLKDIFKYDSNIDYSNIENAYEALLNYGPADALPNTEACMITDSRNTTNNKYNIIRMGTNNNYEEKCGTPIIVDKAGHSDISIESFVNNEEEVNLTQSDNVQIKVFLKNSGSAPSYDNVVVSEVPEGVEYVEGSANANGIYNPEDRTVTWNLEYLDANDGYMFAYDVAVTTGQSSNIYVTTSSVTSNENTTPVESNEARVTTPGMGSEDIPDNPKTGDTRNAILVFGLLISFGFLYYSFSKRSFKL